MTFVLRRVVPVVFLIAIVAVACSTAPSASPSINISGDNRASYPNGDIPRYEKFEVTFAVGGVGTAFSDYNPYNDRLDQPNSNYWNKRGIQVDAIFTKPNGSSATWPCFWYEGSDGWKGWKLRFSPTDVGNWSYRIQVKYGSDTVQSALQNFKCVSSNNPGPIRVSASDPRHFEFAAGSPYVPIGTGTEGWDPQGWVSKHKTILPKLSANGANFVRLFTARSDNAIEPYMSSSSLNKYHAARCRDNDTVFDLAKEHGIYLVFMLDDWTWFKDSNNPYIGSGCCANATDVFNGTTRDGLNNAREIYKRKIRYVMARWGYSSNLMAVQMLNESYGASTTWHTVMGDYIQSFTAMPRMATTSLGSSRIRSVAVEWEKPAMSYTNYHDYARISNDWDRLDSGPHKLEKLGCTHSYPWYDMAVWVDRLARVHYKRYQRDKPLIWEEFGLIKVDSTTSDSGWGDWTSAYSADTQGRFYKDAIWAGLFALCPVAQWKSAYMLGIWPSSGPEKYWMYKPLSNYAKGEDFRGLTQTTAYSVSDPLNSNPKVTCSNASRIQVMALHGPNKAYVYAKNLTDAWYRFVSSGSVPSPSAQSGTVRIMGMTPGTYKLEGWSTTETDPAKQILSSENLTVGSDGTATINISNLGLDVAYKIKSGSSTPPPVVLDPNITLAMSADKTTALPGTQVTYTINYTNSGDGEARSVTILAPIPGATTFVSGSASAGGTFDSAQNRITWTIPSVAAGASGYVTFRITVN